MVGTIEELVDTDRNLGKGNFGPHGQSACGGKADYPDGGCVGLREQMASCSPLEAIRRDLWFQMYPKFAEYHRESWRKAEAFAEQGFGHVRIPRRRRLQYMADTDGGG